MTITDGGPRTRHATIDPAATQRTGTRPVPAPRVPGRRAPAQHQVDLLPPTPPSGPGSARTRQASRATTAATPRVRLATQVAVVAVAVAAYFLVRGATEAAYDRALRNAHLLVDLERTLGIWWEPTLQETLAGSASSRAVLNTIYIYGHWPVIVVSLWWLSRAHPLIYLRARNAMLLSGGIGLVVFAAFPVAPPRLADLGMTDTVSVAAGAYRVLQPTLFTNQYAALPSLHVGWNLVIGLALAAALRRPLLRAAALAMPAAMVVAVVLTANHYIVDAVAGAALTTTCWLLVQRFPGRSRAMSTGTSNGSPRARAGDAPSGLR